MQALGIEPGEAGIPLDDADVGVQRQAVNRAAGPAAEDEVVVPVPLTFRAFRLLGIAEGNFLLQNSGGSGCDVNSNGRAGRKCQRGIINSAAKRELCMLFVKITHAGSQQHVHRDVADVVAEHETHVSADGFHMIQLAPEYGEVFLRDRFAPAAGVVIVNKPDIFKRILADPAGLDGETEFPFCGHEDAVDCGGTVMIIDHLPADLQGHCAVEVADLCAAIGGSDVFLKGQLLRLGSAVS